VLEDYVNKRRTFAIISHPDAGKTTVTEKMLLFGNLIQLAGTVKGKKSNRYAVSDWMEVEKERGISITTSIIQFPYNGHIINLLDTPGHEDFSEDTYRTLTAVDSVIMVIDGVKGVEKRTLKLMEICRLRSIPILTFINKFDRDTQDVVKLVDEIEEMLDIKCAPINWPISSGKSFKGVYNLYEDKTTLFENGHGHHIHNYQVIEDLNSDLLTKKIGYLSGELREEVNLIKGASYKFDLSAYRAGEITPVFFGTALSNFGVKEMLDDFTKYAPPPQPRQAKERTVQPNEKSLTGFVFKVQANMDLHHRDRIAFLRICSGKYEKGMKLFHVRSGKYLQISSVLICKAGDREQVNEAYTGDIIGIHNHGTIKIGDVFTLGEKLRYSGIPNFSPEIFKQIKLNDHIKMKSFLKGLKELSEEGAIQIFRPLNNSSNIILGAIGVLQFDVIAQRLEHEYNVKCFYKTVNIMASRWIQCSDRRKLELFTDRYHANLALDAGNHLAYLAQTHVNMRLIREKNQDIEFLSTREQ
jgi:peptide chain release factor 3